MLAAWALLTPSSPRVLAAPADPSVEVNDAWVDFPESIDFHLLAESDRLLVGAQLEVGLEALGCGEQIWVAQPEFEPASQLDLTWRWQVAGELVLPPGAVIWWRWQLTDDSGSGSWTPRETISFDDDWFVWQELAEGNLIVRWYRGSPELARDMLVAGQAALDQLAVDTGLLLTEPVFVYLYEEPFDLRVSIPGAPAWIGGIAFPEHSIVLAVANEGYRDSAVATVRHELGHVVIGRLTHNCVSELPTWLSEGLAMIAEGENDERAEAALQSALADNRLLTLQQLQGSFSVYTGRAVLSYAESHSVTRYLVDRYGQKQMLALLEALADGHGTDQALSAVYGFDSHGLEDEWRAAIGAPALVAGIPQATAATPMVTLAPLGQPAVVAPTEAPSPTPATVATLPPPRPSATPHVASPTPSPVPVPTPSWQTGWRGAWLAGGALAVLGLVALLLLKRRS